MFVCSFAKLFAHLTKPYGYKGEPFNRTTTGPPVRMEGARDIQEIDEGGIKRDIRGKRERWAEPEKREPYYKKH